MLKRSIAIMLVVLIFATVFAGCGTVASSKNIVTATVGPEPATIDPALNTAADSANYIVHVFEGLTTVDKDGKTVPGVAKSWKVSDDGLKYTFTLRDDAKWSDGKPVTAADFEYAWKRALDPELASEYAYQMYYLKNGQAYNEGKGKVEDVAVKAVNDTTLEVELEAATSYFIDLTNFPTYFPVRKDIVEANGLEWIQKPETYIGNGLYKMTAWDHSAEIRMVKNENYWNKDVKSNIDEIRWVLTDDHPAALNAFEAGDHDYNDGLVPTAELPRLIDEGKVTEVGELGINYVIFNTKKAPLDNLKVRQALSLAIDRQRIVDKVLQGGQKVAMGYVPYGMPGMSPKNDFRSEKGSKDFFKTTADIEGAKKLLAEAGYPEGKGLPEIEYTTNPNDVNNKVAEALQSMFADIGVKMKITTMEWAVFLDYRVDKKHQVARGAWSGDYLDPMTFMDLFVTGGPYNDPDWSNARYDQLISDAKKTTDAKKRMPMLHEAEELMLNDAIIAPISFRNKNTLINEKLKGTLQTSLGFVYFHYAYWEN